VHQYALSVLQGLQRFTAFNVLRMLPAGFYSLSVVLLFIGGENRLLPVVLALVSAYVLAAVISITVASRHVRPDWLGMPAQRGQFFAFAIRGHIGHISPVDSLRLDQIAVALFLTPVSLGIYVVAYAFTNLPRFIAHSAGLVAYPVIAAKTVTQSARYLIWRFFWIVSLLTIAIGIMLIIWMTELVNLFFGSDFLDAVPIARILMVGSILVAMRRILVEGVRGLAHAGISTLAEISMYPWLVTGGPLMMKWYGIKGLAVALAIGYGISLGVAVAATLRLVGSKKEFSEGADFAKSN
jgi:O-antigen/teichoic acid export membrane protein